MRRSSLILAACAIAAAMAAGGCETLNSLGVAKPSASLKGVAFGDINSKTATLIFNTEVVNPYPAALPLSGLDYSLTSAGAKLFAGTAGVDASIPAKSSKAVAVPVSISYADLWTAFKGIRPGSKIPYEASVGLAMKAPVIGETKVPISKKGELAVPELNAGTIENLLLDALKKK